MNRLNIAISQEQLAEFCRTHHIRTLAVFGSVLREDFRPDSDVDVLVEFEPNATHSLFDLARMEGDLAALFHRKVDLVEDSALKNPFRRHEILRTRQIVYDAA
jgi:uncharacterized protein